MTSVAAQGEANGDLKAVNKKRDERDGRGKEREGGAMR